MPTYEYECKFCGHELELFQNMTADPLKKCTECGKNTLKRKIGAGAGIIFKGSGFYETDYKRNNSEKDSKPQEKTDAKNDSKPEAKKNSETSGNTKKSVKSGGGDEKK